MITVGCLVMISLVMCVGIMEVIEEQASLRVKESYQRLGANLHPRNLSALTLLS